MEKKEGLRSAGCGKVISISDDDDGDDDNDVEEGNDVATCDDKTATCR